MTLRDLPSPIQNTLAIFLLFASLYLAWVIIVGPVVAAFDRQSRAITQSEELLIRTKQEAGRVEPLQAEVSALDQAIHTAPLYHRGATVERLTATLQQQFMAIASRDGTQVRSLRALPGPEEGTTRSISLRASLVIELGALVQLLHALDAHRPNLSIDLVEVRATPGQAAVTMVVAAPKAIGPLLAIDLRLSAVATVGPE